MTDEEAQSKKRRKPAEQPVFERDNLTPILFVTVCAKDRKPILAREPVHCLLREIWSRPENHWRVGHYVILPDHIHMFAAPSRNDALSVRRWVSFWKSAASRVWPWVKEQPIWQPEAWDRQLRSGEGYEEKWRYVRDNPVRHGFVERAEDWPFQGELESLPWHDA